VRWQKQRFALVPIKDVKRLTGLEPANVLTKTGTELLTRVDAKGKRVECVRLPVELLLEPPEETA
jgi:hypothetical protein